VTYREASVTDLSLTLKVRIFMAAFSRFAGSIET